MQGLMIPDERARHCSVLAACAPASAAIEAPKSRRTPRGLTDITRLCPCHPIVKQLQSAQQLHVEVVVGLATTPCVGSAAAKLDAMPGTARSARPHRCEAYRSACMCRNVLWSCLCSACGNVFWSVHCGRACACARARVCACAVQVLPNEPSHAGNGPPVVELHTTA